MHTKADTIYVRESNPHNKTDILIFRYGADPYDQYNQTTPGPLAVLINAMLGEESWFHSVSSATNIQEVRDSFVSACTRGLPFSTYSGYPLSGFSSANVRCSFLDYPALPELVGDNQAAHNQTSAQIVGAASRMVAEWFSGFGHNASTADALEAGLYLASEALLALTADASRLDGARPVYVSGGTAAVKPTMRNPAKAIVSALVLAEAAGLLALAWASYRAPTFASRLDAVHVAAIGAQVAAAAAAGGRRGGGAELPPLGLPRRGLARLRYLKRLEETDGLIGVEEEVELAQLHRSSAITPRTSATLTPGPGLHHSLTQPQGPATSSPPSPVGHGSQQQRLSGSHASLSFTPRPPRVNSYASSSHTNDDIISTLGAVSEGNDPDGPPKYEDVVQANVERAAARRRLVIGGSGRISRDMARISVQPATRRRAAQNARMNIITRADTLGSPLGSRNRSNRSSAIGIQNLWSSRTA